MPDTTRTIDLLIGGKWTPAASGATTTKVRNLDGTPLSEVAAAGRSDAAAAVDAAAAAKATWGTWPPGQRREVLLRAAALLTERGDDIVQTMSRETGAVLGWCHFNLQLATGMLAEAAAQTYGIVGEVIPSDVPGLTALGVRQPVGVVVGLAPWNAPLILGMRAVALPLAYGNTVVLKASEESPATHVAIVAALHDAGMPPGAINVITNAPADAADIVDELICHPQTRCVNFTGSTSVGRIIGEKAGRHLKRTVLELGGKAPMLVLADADIPAAVRAAAFGSFMNQGQICMSTERIVVDRTVADEFCDQLAAHASRLTVGDPLDPSTQLGPMVHQRAADHVASLVADAELHGAEVLTGGQVDGLFYPPTIVRKVTSGMRIYSEESFGPVPEEQLTSTSTSRVAGDRDGHPGQSPR
ncbi:aldehyde dehydrogenase family protein [Solwaraspora sp. WMMD406]|uniref:aldehyde dehydrogenase family protein n=1 Tax=Solwaraspora sp. WMMD406 TaxID=3016095 RepID=UPI002416EABD|nr:aldehyde dehydrogenase family protein [Solwaraspora sp. WMMD406]MDG4764378.1 aldehyde dehydrogenase family protein [Solwaraspora sp. WMMD406]